MTARTRSSCYFLCANNEGGRGPQLLRFTNMDMSAMLRAATTGDVEGLKKVRSGVGFSRIGLEKFHNVVHGFDVASDEGIVAICGEGACASTVWQREASPSDPKHSSTAAGRPCQRTVTGGPLSIHCGSDAERGCIGFARQHYRSGQRRRYLIHTVGTFVWLATY